MEESTTPAGGLGDGERLTPTVDGSAILPRVMAEAVGSSRAEARVSHAAPESGTEKPMVPGDKMTLPKVSEGVVEHAVRPPSPSVVPPAMEEDEVEEIEHEES